MDNKVLRRMQVFIFIIGWIAYASTYLLRKPLGVIKADMELELHLSKTSLGWLDSALLFPYAVMQMALGPLGDKCGARQTFGWALIVSAISMISFGAWDNIYMFAFLLFVNGTAQSQCWPNATKILTTWFSDEVRNSVFGMFGTCVFAGGVIATMFTVYLQANYGWRSTHVWSSFIVLAVGVVILLFYRPSDDYGGGNSNGEAFKAPSQTGQVLTMWELWRIPMVTEAAVGMFCLKIVRYCMYMWLPMYLLQQLQYSQSMAGMLSTAFEVGGILGTASVGFLIDRVFQGRSLLGTGLCMICSAVGLSLFTLTGNWGVLFNVTFLFFAGAFNAGPDSILGGAIPSEIAQLDGRNAVGATIGFVNGFGSLGSCLEGPLVGLISTHYGWSSVFYLMTGLSILGAMSVFRASAIRQSGSKNVEPV